MVSVTKLLFQVGRIQMALTWIFMVLIPKSVWKYIGIGLLDAI